MVTPRPVFEQLTPTILIRIEEVKARTGYEKSAIYGWIKEQKFPSPVRPGRWDAAEVEEWIRQNKARRPNNAWDRSVVANPSRPSISTINNSTGRPNPEPIINENLQAQLDMLSVVQMSSSVGFQSLQPCQPELHFDPVSGSVFLLIMKLEPADPAVPSRSGKKDSRRSKGTLLR